ncbi:MAG: 4Fe-4S dicluster domain-containing protein [Planctomycetes bacterium]|jgi:ferredoxin|nr:4Fe-4S dicluster domain-containing protein [Planctomycetota bacterium]
MKEPEQKLVVPNGWLEALVRKLRVQGTRVLAPVERDGAVDFREINSADEMAANYVNTRVPLKEILFPRTETILEFDQPSGGDVVFSGVEANAAPTIVIGARPCDLSAIGVLDTVFNWDYHDTFYGQRRANTTFVGVACREADGNCFCGSVAGGAGENEGSDVFVRPTADGALLEIMTERGKKLAQSIDDAAPAAGKEEPLPVAATEERFDVEKIKGWLDDHFDDDFWLDVSLKCLGCGACSYLCPTCHCFDIVDESDWRGGERRRNWDCCSFALFTLHTSGHNPRPDQQSRCRNRLMHKFKYFVERFGRRACVGCGRCIRVCGAGQNIVNVLIDITRAEAATSGSA